MITADGWFDWAERDPGPPWKTNGGRNGNKGMIPHSAEGYWPHLRDILWGVRRASWTASNLRDGRFIQHYPVFAQVWTSGAGYPNNNFPTTENEGVAGEPLTQAQIDNLIRMGNDLSDKFGWRPKRPFSAADFSASLFEHNEAVRFGADATACPSGRIPWQIIVPALEADVADVTKGEFGALYKFSLETRALVVALGHGLAAVAKSVGANQEDIDDIETALAEQEQQMVALAKFIEDADK